MSLRSLTDIQAEALNLGFCAAGVARAQTVDARHAEAFMAMIDSGRAAGMDYLKRNIEKRLDPTLLHPGARWIISVAMNYKPAVRISKDQYQIAAYAYGKDYHEVMKERLHMLADKLMLTDYKACCDTAPVMERYWAERAGVGYVCLNHQLMVPGVGSMVFLGEIITADELIIDDQQPTTKNQQPTTHNQKPTTCPSPCLRACPTKAFDDEGGFDARRCLSYLTIENRGDIPQEMAAKMGGYIYGCDCCQLACPGNNDTPPTQEPLFMPSEKLLAMRKDDWHNLTEDEYRLLFKGSAVKRAKYTGLMRNINLKR